MFKFIKSIFGENTNTIPAHRVAMASLGEDKLPARKWMGTIHNVNHKGAKVVSS